MGALGLAEHAIAFARRLDFEQVAVLGAHALVEFGREIVELDELLHLTYTRRDLPQQLVQLDYLTPELYERMSPEHRYLLEIEPPREGDGVLRQPKRAHGRGWWN